MFKGTLIDWLLYCANISLGKSRYSKNILKHLQQNEFKISSIVTYLNRAILQSLGFTTKSRLVLDPTDYSLSLFSNETPFIPFHLTPNSNQADWNENFKKKLPASNKRIIFTTDTIYHDLFKYIKPSVCAITLQRRDPYERGLSKIGLYRPQYRVQNYLIEIFISLESA